MATYRLVCLAAAALLLAGGCARNSAAQQQSQFAQAVANDVVTKFVVIDPANPSQRLGAYAVVRAHEGAEDTISCTYTPGGHAAVTENVRMLKIDAKDQRPYYSAVSASDALNVIVQARATGEGLGKIADILSNRDTGYDPFPRDARGERYFILTDCKGT